MTCARSSAFVPRLESEIAGLDASLRELVPRIGRLVLLESEYARAMRQAELEWVRSLIEELRSGAITWDPEVLLRLIASAQADTGAKSAV